MWCVIIDTENVAHFKSYIATSIFSLGYADLYSWPMLDAVKNRFSICRRSFFPRRVAGFRVWLRKNQKKQLWIYHDISTINRIKLLIKRLLSEGLWKSVYLWIIGWKLHWSLHIEFYDWVKITLSLCPSFCGLAFLEISPLIGDFLQPDFPACHELFLTPAW